VATGRSRNFEEDMTMSTLFRMMALGAGLLLTSGIGAVLEAQVVKANKGAQRVWLQGDDDVFQTSGFDRLTTMNLQVPAAQEGVLVIRFSAESRCMTTAFPEDASTCVIEVWVDRGTLVYTLNFDSVPGPGSGDDFWEAHSGDVVTPVLGPGAHTVELFAYHECDSSCLFSLDDWVLTAEYWRTQ
jgi:hypothetical protein